MPKDGEEEEVVVEPPGHVHVARRADRPRRPRRAHHLEAVVATEGDHRLRGRHRGDEHARPVEEGALGAVAVDDLDAPVVAPAQQAVLTRDVLLAAGHVVLARVAPERDLAPGGDEHGGAALEVFEHDGQHRGSLRREGAPT